MTMIDRRSVLAAGTALFAAGAAGAAPRPPDTLKVAAATRGRRFGSAFAWSPPGTDAGSFANPAYAALLRRDCDVLVAEDQMKCQAIRPAPDGSTSAISTRWSTGRCATGSRCAATPLL